MTRKLSLFPHAASPAVLLLVGFFAAAFAGPAAADGRDHGPGWRNDARIGCESSNGRYKLCQVAIRGNVRLVREHSRADCVEGRSWGWSEAGIWVDRGCRGEFTYTPRTVGYGAYRDGRGGRDGWSEDHRGRDGWHDDRSGREGWGGGGRGELRCESNRGRTAFCPAPVQGNVVLTKQLSHAPCRYGDTWTFDRGGISVRDGCRAEFRFDTRRR